MKRTRHSILLTSALVLVVMIAGVPAHAVDDGGARSVFAYGAGNRALGLGGAYGAIADDASAPLWNAAGLGLVVRPEMQVTQAGYYGLQISEQFASIVFPHWRYGTTSVTFRRFGVDGIEERDERNGLLSSDLSNTETELLLGYGRRMTRAWAVGGALKFRRHDLAGFNDSGVGLDLGVLFRPFAMFKADGSMDERLTIGLSVRNALTPELRLRDDRVADPTGVRLGAAYLASVFGAQTVLVAVDIEKTSNMDVRLHSGLEYAVHPLLRLRAGINDGNFSTGTGMVWKGVAVDYTFEQNQIENVHRVGATFVFGRSVGQARMAAVEAQEEELQARLDATFAKRQAARVSGLLMEADLARSEGRYEDALYTLAAVAALDPSNEGAAPRRAGCLYELGRKAELSRNYAAAMLSYSEALSVDAGHDKARAGYDRSRAESDRLAARSQERRRIYATAMDAFLDTRLIAARDGFEAVLAETPSDEEAAGMLERTNRAIERAASDLVEQANRSIDIARFDDAQAALTQARTLAPATTGIEVTRARLERAKLKAAATTTRTTTTTTQTQTEKFITDDQRREAERLYKQAIDAVSARRSDDAIRYLELIWSIDPGYPHVADHLKREYLTRGMEYFADGDLDKAVDLWERVLRVDPDDKRARGYLTRAREQANRTREILGGSR